MVWSPISLELFLKMRTVHADSRNQRSSTSAPSAGANPVNHHHYQRLYGIVCGPNWHFLSLLIGHMLEKQKNLKFTISLRNHLVPSTSRWSNSPSSCLPRIHSLSLKSSLCYHQATPTLRKVSLNWNKNSSIGSTKKYQMPTIWLMLVAFI